MDFLKPNKGNLIGTAALLVANYLGSFVSSLVSRFAMQPAGGTYAGNVTGMAGRGAAGAARLGGSGLVGGAVNFVILAVLFYVVLAFVMDKFAKEPTTPKSEKAK